MNCLSPFDMGQESGIEMIAQLKQKCSNLPVYPPLHVGYYTTCFLRGILKVQLNGKQL